MRICNTLQIDRFIFHYSRILNLLILLCCYFWILVFERFNLLSNSHRIKYNLDNVPDRRNSKDLNTDSRSILCSRLPNLLIGMEHRFVNDLFQSCIEWECVKKILIRIFKSNNRNDVALKFVDQNQRKNVIKRCLYRQFLIFS